MNDETEARRDAVAGQVDRVVRPRAWLWTDINGDTQVNVFEQPPGTCEPLYDQAAVEALVNQYADDERNQAELRLERALKQTWQAIDPLRPAGQPGSYARGYDNGFAAALEVLRGNLGAERSR